MGDHFLASLRPFRIAMLLKRSRKLKFGTHLDFCFTIRLLECTTVPFSAFSTLYEERPSAKRKEKRGMFSGVRVYISQSQPAIPLLPMDLRHSAEPALKHKVLFDCVSH